MTTKAKRTFMQTGLGLSFCLFLVAAAAFGRAKIGAAEAMEDSSYRVELPCQPSSLLTEFFDGVTPPALPSGWSSTTWVTSNSGVPMPPADTPPNAVFADDPATISDKQLLSPSITLICDAGGVQVSFRNNFNFQDGFDGGVLEVSYDGGLTFQDVLAAGGTFVLGGYNGTINSCCGNPLAGRQAWTGNSAGFIDTTVVVFLVDALPSLSCAGELEVTAASPVKAGASTTLISSIAGPLSGDVQARALVRHRGDYG
jgi:hypothetical protein